MSSHIQHFTDIYERCIWGNNGVNGYSGSSGGGSDIAFNESSYVPFLKMFLTTNGIKSVVDLGCGDFRCGSLIYDDLPVTYTGLDAYEKIVMYNSTKFCAPKYTFKHMDFTNNKEDIPSADVCILKDVLQHWLVSEIYDFMDYLVNSNKFKYILICNGCAQTMDDPTNENRSTPLSCLYKPLKKYNAIKLLNYNDKEVSVIVTNKM